MLPSDTIADSDTYFALYLVVFFALSPAMTVGAGLVAGLLARGTVYGLLVGLALGVAATLVGLGSWLVFWPVLRSHEAMLLPQLVSGAVFAPAAVGWIWWRRREKWRFRYGDGGSSVVVHR